MSATGAAQSIALRKTAHPPLRWVILGGLAATIAIVLFYQFGKPAGTTAPQPSGVEAAKMASQTTVNTVSIAVLPFDNISGDAGGCAHATRRNSWIRVGTPVLSLSPMWRR